MKEESYMGRGGRGGGSHHHSSHRSHSHHSHHHHHHHHHSYGRRGYYTSTSTSGSIGAFVILMIIMLLALFPYIRSTDPDSNITKSTIKRTKLSSSLCTDIGRYYTDELDWIHNSATLSTGMSYFYQTTGVQPHLYITDNIAGNTSGNFSTSELSSFGNEIYDSLFNDEGHILVIFCEYRDSQYECYVKPGNDAVTVIDSQAREILLDYVDKYYFSDYADEEYFSLAFRKAADRIMGIKSSSTKINIVPVIVIIIVVVAFMRAIIKRKRQAAVSGIDYNSTDPYSQNMFGQNQYGQNQYGQTQYGQNQYGQDLYGQNQFGQNQYGQNQYGQNQYGQNQYGQTQYDHTQPPYQSSYNGSHFNNNNNNGF